MTNKLKNNKLMNFKTIVMNNIDIINATRSINYTLP